MCRVCLCHSMHHEIRRSSIDLKTERNELRLPGPLSGVSSQRTGPSVAKYANCGRRRSCNLQLNFWQGNCNANAQVPPRYLCTALFLSLRLWLLSLRLSHFHARKCPSRSYHSNREVREREANWSPSPFRTFYGFHLSNMLPETYSKHKGFHSFPAKVKSNICPEIWAQYEL